MPQGGFRRSGLEWFSSLPACLLLLAVVLFSTSSDIHNQMLRAGEQLWSGYYKLRMDPVQPECDLDRDIEAEVARELAEQAPADDPMAALLGAHEKDPREVRLAIERSVADCRAAHASYEDLQDKLTPGVKAYRAVELFVADLIAFGLTAQRYVLVILVMLCAVTATLTRHHIAMRAMETRLDYTVSYTLQTIANAMLLGSSVIFRQSSLASSTTVSGEELLLHNFWIVGFACLTLASLYRLFRVSDNLAPGGNLNQAFLSVPLYTVMCLISGTYFALIGHSSGIGIYLGKMMELADMFLNVGLYVWVGMMLKQTRLATLVFNIFRPWRMPPEMLAVVAVLVAAVPTAYTGASGIFVIAAGAVIYSELRAAGARRHLALAATAMSGSLGVVLRPCLLVVVIAYLNREVTTDELFGWGIWVFVLTATMFAMVALTVNRQSQFDLAPAADAFPASIQALRPLIPYVIVIAAVVLFYRLALDVKMDEFSAPRLLPVIMLAILVYEHISLKNGRGRASGEINHQGLERSVRGATNDTTAEIGALLLLLGLSVSIGGVIERSHIMETFPQAFDSPWSAMLLMVVILVILGMIMDAFGAVILVTATVATIAYSSGIHPVHFWMVTLVAFELGYLSPPVALNHLLTRQVVGEAEVLAAQQEGGTFYQRHERIIMPLIAMGISLILVAFVPLLFYAN
ncbi:TRAP transporter large permease subunit [Marinobacter nauticus]|uniref:TRAP transporter large permease subunit n=1 Tax=Marinobacter nauticus TaxID=2743 RepID=UPI001C9993F6|nr:TRAP transporter large permease subunit [Marinobacter nauticus]MBY5937525.1 TRAP transporter large permease subunit [Marinobacter nauticus]MBY5954232.1 TRAP transporter large permease subunit [Marinobacter nauticus]MBY6008546.1 TRAP transporter large permease subunit [Marinobacter nauticus]